MTQCGARLVFDLGVCVCFARARVCVCVGTVPLQALVQQLDHELRIARQHNAELNSEQRSGNTKGYSSTYLARMGFANVRAGTQKSSGVFGYPPEH